MIEQSLKEMYPSKILDRADYPHVAGIHPVNMNAVDGLRLAL